MREKMRKYQKFDQVEADRLMRIVNDAIAWKAEQKVKPVKVVGFWQWLFSGCPNDIRR